QSGQTVAAFEAHIQRNDGTRFEAMMSATPLLNDNGKSRGAIAAILDITERRAAEARQQILLHELQHRVKNIITTIGALATRMLRDSSSMEDFSQAFLGRLPEVLHRAAVAQHAGGERAHGGREVLDDRKSPRRT